MSRLLYATDLSEGATVGERLISSIPWPAGTACRVVTVVPWIRELVGAPWVAVAPTHPEELEAAQLRKAETGVRETAARLATRGLSATWSVMRGPAADAIVELATIQDADLVVVGSRGLGALQGALLGSVSEAVADRAPCPVLVARGDAIHRSVIADDASPGAELAVDYVLERPYLLGAETRLVSVTNIDPVWAETFDLPIDAHSVQRLVDDQAEFQAETRLDLEAAAQRFREVGLPAVVDCVEGVPGAAIVDTALGCGADLVVVGSRHRTGLARLVLGSVGRHVLRHSPCSVLSVGRVPRPAPREPAARAGSAVAVS